MPKARAFSQLGLFVVERFFTPEYCADLRAEVRASSAVQSRVERHGAYLVDETVRRTTGHIMTETTLDEVASRLAAIRPDIERHFETTLVRQEPPYFATYTAGDYFKPHIDSAASDDAPQEIKDRKVAVVVFLNDETDEPTPDSFCGGALTFYGLFADPQWKAMGLPLRGEAGLLVGFRADLVHEVAPITHGERYTVITRFS
jgi:SM-20-related protein